MLRSLNSGVTGLTQFQERMDVIGNNIANVNTVGFKSARTEFSDAFSQTLREARDGSSAVQIGSGVATASIKNLYGQGAVEQTGNNTDLAIVGDGFFVVQDKQSSENYATRAGQFIADQNGYLVTSNGLRVQGFSDAALTTRGDIQINTTGAPATSSPTATVQSFTIDKAGNINVQLSDGTSFVRGQVLLQNFSNPQALAKAGDNLYTWSATAGAMATAAVPGSSGVGIIQAQSLELSNVDLTKEFADLITTQRAFQANARIITTSDELMQETVNLKR
jgi:flagellar hook protein FlgE